MNRWRQIKAFVNEFTSSYRSGATQPRQPAMRDIFSDIYQRRGWDDPESVSGPGSGLVRTEVFRDKIAVLLRDIQARSLLDGGCGDFNWMKEVELELDRYIGIDVVPELIQQNQERYGDLAKSFIDLDITRDPLPRADVILCRDCLVHFSYEDIFATLRNFRRSESTYLLTTTFIKLAENSDIKSGGWRPLNLQLPPFGFSEPAAVIDEKCTHTGGIYADKRLVLWELKSIDAVPRPSE